MFHHLQRCSPSSQGPRDLHGLHGRGLSSRWKLRKQPDSRVCSEPVVGAQTRGIPRNSSVKVNSFEGLSHKFMETHGWQAVFIWQMKDFACATEKIDRQVLVWINLDETFACSLECLRGCVLVTSSGKLTQRIRIFFGAEGQAKSLTHPSHPAIEAMLPHFVCETRMPKSCPQSPRAGDSCGKSPSDLLADWIRVFLALRKALPVPDCRNQ